MLGTLEDGDIPRWVIWLGGDTHEFRPSRALLDQRRLQRLGVVVQGFNPDVEGAILPLLHDRLLLLEAFEKEDINTLASSPLFWTLEE
jgi:hypothetical protein